MMMMMMMMMMLMKHAMVSPQAISKVEILRNP
jgi:hypothetical protein